MTRAQSRCFLAPEVVQTSAMDCGPAALKCLLEGYGIPTSYGRLREACQTEVDGSSIDTLEDITGSLGLSAQQVMLPVDDLLLESAAALPAIVIVRIGSSGNHFVVLWRKLGGWVQVMDPECGRRLMRATDFLRDVYVHTLPVGIDAVREWLTSDSAAAAFRERFDRLRATQLLSAMFEEMRMGGDVRRLARLDAALRFCSALVRTGSLSRGADAARFVKVMLDRLERGHEHTIPERFWTIRPAQPSEDGNEQVLLTGAVLLKVSGRCSPEDAASRVESLPPEIAAAVKEPPLQPARELWKALRRERLSAWVILAVTLVAAAGGALEIVMLRALFNIGRELPLVEQRLLGFLAVAFVSLALLGLELPLASNVLRLGRALELRLRVAFFEKLPRLGDRYMQSRPASDMAERSHSLHSLRHLPDVAGQFIRVAFDIAAAVAGLIWLDPGGAPVTLCALLGMLFAAVVLQSRVAECDLRLRSLAGGLTRFYLDALLGIAPVKSHAAEKAVQHEHEKQLAEWWRTGLALIRISVTAEGVAHVMGGIAAAALLGQALSRQPDGRVLLLLLYWVLSLPSLAQELSAVVRRFPMHRSLTLRLLEPMGALEEGPQSKTASSQPPSAEARTAPEGSKPAVALEFRNLSVRASGHVILEGVSCKIESGEHVAIVGPSGAGKSSLAGVVLGFHRPSEGAVLIDGEVLASEHMKQLRRDCAWLDPQLQLWNRTLFENLVYGSSLQQSRRLDDVMQATELSSVLRRLPDGLQTTLGEGGGLVSGGEGQRVRLGRALLRPHVRLAILDEAFRGLGRTLRKTLLERVRAFFKDATLLAVTHDVQHALDFERVLVIERGTVVEDGRPSELAQDSQSRFRSLLDAETELAQEIISTAGLKPIRLEQGRIAPQETAA